MWLADDFVRSLPGFGELPERVRVLVGEVPLMACDHCGEPLCYEWFRYNDDDLCSVECEEARAGGEMAYLAAYYGIWGPEQDVLSAKYDVRIPQKVKDAVFGPDATYEGAEAAILEWYGSEGLNRDAMSDEDLEVFAYMDRLDDGGDVEAYMELCRFLCRFRFPARGRWEWSESST